MATRRVAWWTERAGTYLAWRPEWPVVVVVAASWVALALGLPGGHQHASTDPTGLGPSGATDMSGMSGMSGMHHHDHAISGVSQAAGATGSGSSIVLLLGWMLMCAAMMLPLALPAARHVAANTFAPRRPRALVVFVAAYLAPYLLLGLLLPLLDAALPGRDVGTGLLVGVGLLVAAAWQVSAWKRWAVLQCSGTVPLPPGGLSADRACAEFGVRQSLRCLAACWPLMTLMGLLMVVPTTLPDAAVLGGMAAVTALGVAESRSRRRRQLIPLLAAPLAAVGALAWLALA